MPKRATKVMLSEKEQEGLTRISRRYRSEQQLALRARMILAAAQGQSNAQIARELDIHVDTARLWRDRWVGLQGIDLETLSIIERLQDAPRPGVKPTITAEQRCQMAALACEAPMKAGRPISQWTGREIAEEVMARGIIEQISPRHAARLLKKGASNRTPSATGSTRSPTPSATRRSARAVRSMPTPRNECNTGNAPSVWMS
jgi:putative transposase